jgi:hypothetical protein
MTDKIPTFEWNSEEDGKKEYHLFDAALQANLATRQCRFVLDENAILINTPINPGPGTYCCGGFKRMEEVVPILLD